MMKITLNHTSRIPLHVQIEEQLRSIIKDPEYLKGKKFPSEVDLSKQLGISRSTLRQAINKMVYEGLLIRKKGFGTVVAEVSVFSKAQNWMSFSQEMKALNIEIKNYELHICWVKADPELCSFFNIHEGTQVLCLERLRGNLEYPFVYFKSYFNPRVGLTGNEDFAQPLYEMLEKNHNTIVKLSKEEISAKAADKVLADRLRIQEGQPVLKRKRFVYDPGGHPVEWNIGYYRSDSFVYTIESDRTI